MLIPKNRHEYYLAVISGNDYPTFPPKTREELYLAKLAGREVDVPIPKTPKERAYYNIINDIKFEPENRWQTFVAAANDDSITSPVPRTREEIWWTNISLSHEVIVEYVGTLPATLKTVEGYLESYKIYGNTEQNGTPTPENPIMPSGCGARTENLFDIESWLISKEAVFSKDGNAYTFSAIQSMYSTPFYFSDTDIPVSISGIITDITAYNTRINLIRADGTIAKSGALTYLTNVKKSENIVCAGLQIDWSKGGTIRIDSIMLNLGSTALPYEPYGYKLPLSSAGQDVDIYLDESQTTRRIGKIDLGTLSWSKTASGNFLSATTIPKIRIIGNTSTGNAICDRLKEVMANDVATQPYSFSSCLNNTSRPFINKTGFEDLTVEEFKQAMSGVYMYYVLATPTTGTLNEPLRKIGDYADTIDSTQTTVQIPTAAGSTTISWAGEGLAPSEVELTYKTVKRAYISADDEVYQDPIGQLLGG